MNPWNLVTGLLVFASLAAALRKLWKDKKNGTGGCSGAVPAAAAAVDIERTYMWDLGLPGPIFRQKTRREMIRHDGKNTYDSRDRGRCADLAP